MFIIQEDPQQPQPSTSPPPQAPPQSPPSSPQPYKKSPVGKYLTLIIFLVIIGAAVYMYKDNIMEILGDVFDGMAKLIPDDIGLFFKCITFQIDDRSLCFGGTTTTAQTTKYEIVDLELGYNGEVNKPMTGEKYSLPISILNLIDENEPIEILGVNGILTCETEEQYDEWDLTSYVELISDYIPPKLIKEINSQLVSEDELNCNLESCQKVTVDLTYRYNNSLRTNFRFGSPKEDPVQDEAQQVGDGPVSIEMEFQPYGDNYYSSELIDSVDELDIVVYIQNKGDGEARIINYNLEKQNDGGEDGLFLTGAEKNGYPFICDFDAKETIEKDEYYTCKYYFNIKKDAINDYLQKNPYKTLIFKFDVGYEYTISAQETVQLEEGPSCLNVTTITEATP